MRKFTLPLIVLSLYGGNIYAEEKINVHYNDRPPYLIMKNGELTGLTGSVAIAAFKSAGIPFQLSNTPATRQLDILKKHQGKDCAVGWFKNPDREKFAKFTKPLYKDKPQVAIVVNKNNTLKDNAVLEEALTKKDAILLMKQSYSYGKFLDGLIEKVKPRQHAVSGENTAMIKIIAANRENYYMFSAPEEFESMVQASGLNLKDFKTINFKDMPAGEQRYILCSQKVEDSLIEKLNSAIK